MVKRGIGLGHIISSEGIEADKEKGDLIANLPLCTCVKDIRSFLDMLDSTGGLSRTLARLLSPYAHF